VYVDGEFHEKDTNFAFCPGSVDVACKLCDSGSAHQSSDFLFEQEQLGDAVLGRASKRLL
jgi:hypothetical protein